MNELRVVELWRYPVKSMLGEPVTEAKIGPFGITGDRAWSLVDSQTGFNLTARREPRLLTAAARLVGESVDDGVIITLPDGTETSDDQILSDWIGRPVRLIAAEPDASGTFETQLDPNETGDWVQWTGPSGSFHDSTRTMVSLVSTTTLRDWDPRRFRTNIILDGEDEDSLVGCSIGLGSTQLDIMKQIDRCVMVTRPQLAFAGEPALEQDRSVLQIISRERNSALAIGALVTKAGVVTVGDVAQISPPEQPKVG